MLFKLEKDKLRLLKNFLSLIILQGTNYLIPLIMFPYLVKVLGVEKFGLIMFAQSFIQYFVILTDYGFNLSATREVSINRNNKKKLSEIFSSVLTVKLFLLLISLILLTIIVFSFEKFQKDWIIYYLTFGIVIGQVLFPLWLFQGLESMKYITILNVSAKIIALLVIFLLVHSSDDYIKVPLVNSLSQILIGLSAIYIIQSKFKIKFVKPSFQNLFYYIRYSFLFFLSRVSVSIYTSTNTFILGLFTDNKTVGFYSIAEKLYIALQQLYSPLVNTIYPYMSHKRNIKFYKKLFTLAILINIFLVFILFINTNEIFKLIFGKVYVESITTFKILLISAVVVVPSILLGYPFLAALGFPKYANLSVVLGSIIHIIGLTILGLTGFINNYSVAFMVLTTELFVLGVRLYGVLKNNLWR